MGKNKDFIVEVSDDPKKVPKRITFIKKRVTAQVKVEEENMVMTFPNLVVRGIIVFQVMVIVLAIISLVFDAPLEWIANPQHTPNPAKAPWYFLGLQELLHYFHPVVAGVLLPMIVVIALIIIPYFEINIKREGLWLSDRKKTFALLTTVVLINVVVNSVFEAYSIAGTTVLVYAFMLIPFLSDKRTGLVGRLANMALAEWVMTWFVVVAFVLTAIGVLFRGPEWRLTLPWVDGIY